MSVEVQWTDDDPDTGERRFVAAERFAGKWTFKVRHRRRENWQKPKHLTRGMWEALLDGLERRFQRREGVVYDDLQAVRKIIAGLPPDDEPRDP